MSAIPLARVGLLVPVINFLNQIGSPTDQLLRQSKLSFYCLEDAESLFPLYQGSEFLENAAQREGIEILGIFVGQQTSVRELGMFGQILGHSLTLFDLLITLKQTVNMANSGECFSLRWEKDWVWVQHHCISAPQSKNLQTQRYSLMLHINVLRLALGSAWRPTELYLEGPPCRELLAVDDFSEARLHFASPCNAIKIPRAALSLPINSAPDPYDLISQPDYTMFHRSAPAEDFVSSLRQLIQVLMARGYPDISLVVDASGMSERSLQRRLSGEGLSYSRLVEQVRFELAVKLLKQPELKLVDVAAELGYADSANFTRAFKRWTGCSPRAFRQSQCG